MQRSAIIYNPLTPALVKRRRVVVLISFILLASAYSFITPIFETSDEVRHYPVIDYIADHKALPVQDPDRPNVWDWQAAQPPLYYTLSAILVAPFDRDDLELYLRENPHTKSGIGLASDNQNLMYPREQSFPWSGTPLYVHVVRLFSVTLGAIAVWMTFSIGRLAVPNDPTVALYAMMLTAFNPMFLAIVGSVNNDNLVIMLSAVMFAVILSVWRDGFTWQRVWALAVLGVLASASKVSGTILYIPAGLMILLAVWQQQLPLRTVAISAVIFVGVWAISFGWWYLRNLELYGDLFGNEHMALTVGLREEDISLVDLFRDEWFSFFAAYWGWLGTLTILAPVTLFFYAGGLMLIGGVGFVGRIRQGMTSNWQTWVPAGVMALTLTITILSLIRWTLTTPASQGRLLFPFSYIISVGMAVGLVHVLKRRVAGFVLVPLMVYAVIMIVVIIPHAFREPPQLERLPADAQALDVLYGDHVQLLGYAISDDPIQQGDVLAVTVYWQVLAQTDIPLSFYIQVFAPNMDLDDTVEVGKLDSYPGRGMLTTTTWNPNTIYEDTYQIEILDAENASYPFEPRLKIGWRDNDTDQEIAARSIDNAPIDSVIVRGGRAWSSNLDDQRDPLATYSGVIELYDVETTQQDNILNLDILWGASQPIGEPFTVFVQLIDPENPSGPLAFGDRVPRNDWWPTVRWVAGDVFRDQYQIMLPDDLTGAYQVVFGFYRPDDFSRLPIDTAPYPDAYAVDVVIE